MTQLSITARDNKNLFSNYYLDNQIKNNPEWKKEEHKAAFSEIKKLYDTEKDFIPALNEKQLEQRFFAPIFKILNHTVEVNEGTEQGEFPDYAFFSDRAALDDAHKKMDNLFYNNAIAIGEVKRWGIELDRFGKDEKDRKRNPSLQIWIYLHDVSPKWGILSNGAKWRLYCKDRRRDDYYEVDLPTIITTNDTENFKYFYYFFRRDAFLRSTEGKIFLDEVLKGSADYAKDIGDDLKDNVYKAMKKVAEGFFSWSQNGLDIQNEAARETVQKCTMLLLYRFLFLLYAEGKGLLDLKKPQYQSYSFYKLKNEVKEKQDGPLEQRYLGVGTSLWAHLKDLFRLINQGSESLGIKDKNILDVPAYNGGLFDPKKNPELEKWIIGDTFLSEAIDLLSRSKADGGRLDFVDYSTLEIRHLGSIYEGLLEYKLRVAEYEMVVNGGEWVKLEEYNKDRKQKKVFSEFNEFDRVNKGQIYLATDKGERKASGSYYTPDYIVNYIVKNTVGPVVDEKWKDAEANKKSFVDATLSVKVLDPAMGSGHFLVGSIEFLSEKLLLAVKKDIDNGRFSDESHLTSDWARREVVSHCIYGVDLNLMAVELAKVGLWLTTISKEKPLSFLDHRLKQGNSFIGAKLEDLPYYPDINAQKKEKREKDAAQQTFKVDIERPFFKRILEILDNLTEINDDSIENIHKKKDLFEKLLISREYQHIKALANVHTAVYFGKEPVSVSGKPKDGYRNIFWGLGKDDAIWKKSTTNYEWFRNAQKFAREKSFFHWELEFPEIFFEGGVPKENQGWDAVVGNPPWGADFDENTKNYTRTIYVSDSGEVESHILFTEKGSLLINSNGFLGYITPNTWLSQKRGDNLRTYLLDNCSFKEIIHLAKYIFKDVPDIVPIIFTLSKGNKFEFLTAKILKNGLNEIQLINDNFEFINCIKYDTWRHQEDNTFNIYLTDSVENLLKKIKLKTEEASKNYEVVYGIKTGNNEKYLSAQKLRENFVPCLEKGAEVRRYEIKWLGKYLDYGTHLDGSKSHNVEVKKIIIQYTRKLSLERRIVAAFDLEGKYYPLNRFSYIYSKSNSLELTYLMAIISSKTINYYHANTFIDYDIKPTYLSKLPIRRISFTTPADRRAALLEQARALYSEFLGAPDSRKILEFIGARLSFAPEESDVVHDLLAYLAERMIEMNKEKNGEIKGFLHWFEGEIGAPVEELTNKTAIKGYYEAGFDAVAGALAKNKKKLKEGYDPTRREPKEKLQNEFNASVGKLAPLLKRIEATDKLIDQIIYKLYGLTEDEIKIVEESISGRKDVKEI